MAAITAEKLLTDVKNAIGITGDYQDNTIKVWINEVKEYLASAGVNGTVLNSEKATGVIARGVLDLWNYGAGDGALSPYFHQRAIQLVYRTEPDEDGVVMLPKNAKVTDDGAGNVKIISGGAWK